MEVDPSVSAPSSPTNEDAEMETDNYCDKDLHTLVAAYIKEIEKVHLRTFNPHEAHSQALKEMGFEQEEVTNALRATNNNRANAVSFKML